MLIFKYGYGSTPRCNVGEPVRKPIDESTIDTETLPDSGASLAFGTGVTAADQPKTERANDVIADPNSTVVRYHDSLRRVTNQPHLLALSEGAVNRHFETADLEGREFERARRYLRNLRKRYPTNRVRSGNVEWITLADEARRTLRNTRRRQRSVLHRDHHSEDLAQPDEGGLPTIQSRPDSAARRHAIAAFGGSLPDDVGIQWNPVHHEAILQQALDDVDSDADMAHWAGAPDRFNQMANGRLGLDDGSLELVDLPDGVPFSADGLENKIGSALKAAMDKTMENYTQYYDPNAVTISIPLVGTVEVTDVGMAPRAGRTFYRAAKLQSGSSEREYLSYATHYLQDMAVPLHTGMGVEQSGLYFDVEWEGWSPKLVYGLDPKHWAHHGFENLVKSEWDGRFDRDFAGRSSRRVRNAADVVEKVARVSTAYSHDIFHTIMENQTSDDKPNQWDVKGEVLENLDHCFNIAGYYTRSFLRSQGFGR